MWAQIWTHKDAHTWTESAKNNRLLYHLTGTQGNKNSITPHWQQVASLGGRYATV